MIFKKFIGALTALVMTMTAFVGLATEVGAYTDDEPASPFNMYKIYLNGSIHPIYPDKPEEIVSIMSEGNSFTHEEKIYVVNSVSYNSTDSAFHIQASVAVELKIKITGLGSVTVGGKTFTDNGSYYAAANSSQTILATASEENSIINNISLSDSQIQWSFTTDNKTATSTVILPENGATLTVNFGAPYTISADNTIVGGTITFSANNARVGETITVYADPANGYEFGSISAYYVNTAGSSTDVMLTKDTNTRYTFTMPDGNVTVTATFNGILPNSIPATYIRDFNEIPNDDPASLWSGTIRGEGYAFTPKVTVTTNDGAKKSATGSTTVSGDSLITIAVVVDKLRNEISSVQLSGVEQGSSSDQEFPVQTPEPSSSEEDESDSTDDSVSSTED